MRQLEVGVFGRSIVVPKTSENRYLSKLIYLWGIYYFYLNVDETNFRPISDGEQGCPGRS